MAKALLVLTTADSEELAKKLADTLVKRHQAACVNIVPGMTSVYRWSGRIKRDPELLLLIKTLETRFEAVSATIREIHGYEVPEVFAIPAHKVGDAYLRWVIYTPYATPESTGLSTKMTENAPWLMDEGTAGAHIMITPPRPKSQ